MMLAFALEVLIFALGALVCEAIFQAGRNASNTNNINNTKDQT